MKTKIGLLSYLVVIAVVLSGIGCGMDSMGHQINSQTVTPIVNNVQNDFSVQFSGHVVGATVNRPLTFSNSKIKLSIISGNTVHSAILGIQIYKFDNSMPYKKSFTLGGNLTIEEIVSLDFIPARIIVDIPDYTATGFTLQLQSVQ